MISITHLFEKKSGFEPFMTGTAVQIGGKGYPTGQYRVGQGPPSVQMAAQKAEEAAMKAQKILQIRDQRRKKNPTQAERAQGAY